MKASLAAAIGIAAVGGVYLLIVADGSAPFPSTGAEPPVVTAVPASPSPPPAASVVSVPPSPSPSSPPSPSPGEFRRIAPVASSGLPEEDPFTYCAAGGVTPRPVNGEDHFHDAQVISALTGRSGPDAEKYGAAFVWWRCREGGVLVCRDGVGFVNCLRPSDTSTTPGGSLRDFCAERPNTNYIPVVYSQAKNSIYQWECRSGVPVITGTRIDADGYRTGQWATPPAFPR